MRFQFKNGEETLLNIGSLVISTSRFKVWVIYPSVGLDCILDFLANAFETIGGVPKEIVIDNATTMMIEARTKTFKGRTNPSFQQFADDYGIKIAPCVAGRPETKAKVESPMRVIEEILEVITNEANTRACQVTGLPPVLVFKKEKNIFCPYHKTKYVLPINFLPLR